MVLEATVICLDNSEWMRNGDYPPTRFQAQTDAINLICGAKTQANPENTVGVLSMAGKGVRVLVTPTADLGKILSSMHGVELGGQSNVLSAVQVAQLALKHRQNKNQRQRIVLFSGSPVAADVDTLVRIGKKLKKNNVALDIVSFGEEDDGKGEKLEALLGAVNSNDNSHLVQVPPGPAMLSDVLISSPIFNGDGEGGSGFAAAAAAGAAAAAAAGGGGGDFDFDVDPNLDPELALALRVSMEEERARQEAAARKAAEEAAAGGGAEGAGPSKGDTAMADAPGTAASEPAGGGEAEPQAASVPSAGGDDPMEDEAALLQEALAMSLAEASGAAQASVDVGGSGAGGAAPGAPGGAADAPADDDDLALALQMSMENATAHAQSQAGAPEAALGDPALLNSILASLPGVDPNDPSVQAVLASLAVRQDQQEGQGDKPAESKDK